MPEVSFAVIPGGALEEALKGTYSGTTVTVDGAMEGNDPDGVKFDQGVKAFEDATGIDVNYIGNKEFSHHLRARGWRCTRTLRTSRNRVKLPTVVDGKVVPVTEFMPRGIPADNQSRDMATPRSRRVYSTASTARAWSGIRRMTGMPLVIRYPPLGLN
jgi:hypothetical protein